MSRTLTYVETLPKCDFCGGTAKYDAQLPIFGSWAYLCASCFTVKGCHLGTGQGQQLKLKSERPKIKRTPPTMRQMEQYLMADGLCPADCEYGCEVELDGKCEHGKESYALIMGLI